MSNLHLRNTAARYGDGLTTRCLMAWYASRTVTTERRVVLGMRAEICAVGSQSIQVERDQPASVGDIHGMASSRDYSEAPLVKSACPNGRGLAN